MVLVDVRQAYRGLWPGWYTLCSWNPRSPSLPWGRSRLCSHHVTGRVPNWLLARRVAAAMPLTLQRHPITSSPSCSFSGASRAAGRGDGVALSVLSLPTGHSFRVSFPFLGLGLCALWGGREEASPPTRLLVPCGRAANREHRSFPPGAVNNS